MILGSVGMSACYALTEPKFEAGQCVAYEFPDPSERWEHRPKYMFSAKILEVGKLSYRTAYWYGATTDSLAKSAQESSSDISYIDRNWIEIDCSTVAKKP